MRKIIRVFPIKTNATPDDSLAYYGPPDMFTPEVDEVHISISFTWDKKYLEWLIRQWEHIAPVKTGGPGCSNKPAGDFEPGKYLKKGYIITSRGCPNKCWFCSVWKRERGIRELPIKDGYILQDDNILACSEKHIKSVFKMLSGQKEKARLMGIEAKLLKSWHIELIQNLKPKSIWCAYDTDDDLDPLIIAGKELSKAGFNRNNMYCYVLIGFPKDTITAAEKRLYRAWSAGFMPFAMLWRNDNGDRSPNWIKFTWPWCRPAAARSICMKLDKLKTVREKPNPRTASIEESIKERSV